MQKTQTRFNARMHALVSAMRLAIALTALGCGAALAQQSGAGAGPGPGPGAGPGSSVGPGPDAPKEARRGSPQWWGSEVTPGWSLMTWTERNEHRKQMRSVKTYEECRRYLEEHHAKMAERAKAQGKPELAMPKRDACAGLKP